MLIFYNNKKIIRADVQRIYTNTYFGRLGLNQSSTGHTRLSGDFVNTHTFGTDIYCLGGGRL